MKLQTYNYSVQYTGPHDASDIVKIKGSKVKVTDTMVQGQGYFIIGLHCNA